MKLVLEHGTPKDVLNRLEKERKVYELLDSLSIPFDRVDHPAKEGMEGYVEISQTLKAEVCKNLFLANRQQTIFYLLMMPGEKKFLTKELSSQIHSARLSFGNEEALKKYLHAGKGYCSILDLMNDEENKVSLLIDEDLLKEAKVGVHPCINTTSLALSWNDLLQKYLPSIQHSYQIVKL